MWVVDDEVEDLRREGGHSATPQSARSRARVWDMQLRLYQKPVVPL